MQIHIHTNSIANIGLIIIKFLLIVFLGGACTLFNPSTMTPSSFTNGSKEVSQAQLTPTTSLDTPSSITQIPTLSLNSCQTDIDCVLAIRVNICCSCPEVATQAFVQANRGIEIYIPGKNYGSLRPAECATVDCPTCPPAPASPVCILNKCQSPATIQEILNTCPNCFVQAAQAAYQSGNLQEAIDFCTKAASDQLYLCFSELFNTALTTNHLNEAEELCREYLNQDVGSCLRSIALKWANIDHQRAVALCNELDPSDARHFSCILEVALTFQSQNQNLALEICAQLPADEAEECRKEILK